MARQVSQHPGDNECPLRPDRVPLRRDAQDANLEAYCQFPRTDAIMYAASALSGIAGGSSSADDTAWFLLGSGVERKKLRPC